MRKALTMLVELARALRELHDDDTKNLAEILDEHVTLELEAIDRMYLNACVPSPQTARGSCTS